MNKLKERLEKILKQEAIFVDSESGEINYAKVKDSADRIDEKLIALLAENKEIRDKFFTKIKDVYVFNINDFKFFLDENKVNNSYTRYANKIGLSDGAELLREKTDVVLDFPFKDCVLEGGQSTEEGAEAYFEYSDKVKKYEKKEAKRDEIFFNQVLAQDEIDRLFDKKALVNWKRYSKNSGKNGEPVKAIKRDKDGLIKENLIIKGNNLLALHSLKSEFTGEIKLIYIDPPYNTGTDSFAYNDRFNHSTWLTFMKNRLEVAKDLLKDDGAIFVQIDHHQLAYINILMDEIFDKQNKVQVIAVRTASPAGFKTVNPGPIDVTEYILFYTKNKPSFKFKKSYVPVGYNKNYNLYVDKYKDISKWKFFPIKDKMLESLGFADEKEAKKKYGKLWEAISKVLISNFAFENADNIVSIRDPHKPTEKVKELMLESKKKNKLIEYKREDGSIMYLYNGGALAFYSNKIKIVDGKKEVTELLTDFWGHISWAGIASEGGVKLKNGKKPEKLLKQIFELATEENDIIIDYHAGSGTTCAVAHKMNRQYIGIEQLDYGDNDSVIRINNVINGDESGISEIFKWKGGGSFVYCELAKWNEQAKKEIEKAKDLKTLETMFDNLYEKYFLNYNVKIREFKEGVLKEENFKKLTLSEQKRMFLTMLDLNQMYVQESEMADRRFSISPSDQKFTKEFYRNK
jgi:adenine-specific DNA-methyltransferase